MGSFPGAGVVDKAPRPVGRVVPVAQAEQPPGVESPSPLAARGLSKRFESLVALDELDLDLTAGAVHALIGPNGSARQPRYEPSR